MSLASDDPEHVVVVPGRHFAATASAGSAAAVSGDKVEGDFAQEGEVAGDGTVAHATVVLAEGDVEHPMQRVRVEQHEDPPEGVVRGDAVWQGQEGLQPSPLAPPVELNVLPALGTGDHRANRDYQDVDQLMIDPARLARISKPGQKRR